MGGVDGDIRTFALLVANSLGESYGKMPAKTPRHFSTATAAWRLIATSPAVNLPTVASSALRKL